MQMLVNNVTTVGIAGANRGVIRALWTRESVFRKAQRQVSIRVNQSVLLLQAKPEIIVRIINGSTAVGFVRSAVRIEHFTHH